MIQLRTRLTSPLGRFVDCLWYSDGESRPHAMERLLPTGRVDIIFKLQDQKVRIFDPEFEASPKCFGGAVVSGVFSRSFSLDTSQAGAAIGVHFRPGGAAPFLGLPVSELMDRHLELTELWGRSADNVRERLIESPTTSSKFDVVEQALLERLAHPHHDYPAVEHAVQQFCSSSTTSVRAVTESMGFRAKRFIRLFHDSVGLTPKLFYRVTRFQSVLDQVATGRKVEWAGVAQSCGYYDQSHLIRDFRAFTGVTPQEYRPVAPGRKNHMALSS